MKSALRLAMILIVFFLMADTSWGQIIDVCYNTRNGNLRYVDDPSECRPNEDALEINQQGPQGPPGLNCWDLDADEVCDNNEDIDQNDICDAYDCQGPEGPEGPQGPAGPAGGFDPASIYSVSDSGSDQAVACCNDSNDIVLNVSCDCGTPADTAVSKILIYEGNHNYYPEGYCQCEGPSVSTYVKIHCIRVAGGGQRPRCGSYWE